MNATAVPRIYRTIVLHNTYSRYDIRYYTASIRCLQTFQAFHSLLHVPGVVKASVPWFCLRCTIARKRTDRAQQCDLDFAMYLLVDRSASSCPLLLLHRPVDWVNIDLANRVDLMTANMENYKLQSGPNLAPRTVGLPKL